MSTSSVNAFIYVNHGPYEATAAGYILLSMVSIVWMYRYGEWSSKAERQRVADWLVHLNEQHKQLEEEVRRQVQMMQSARSNVATPGRISRKARIGNVKMSCTNNTPTLISTSISRVNGRMNSSADALNSPIWLRLGKERLIIPRCFTVQATDPILLIAG